MLCGKPSMLNDAVSRAKPRRRSTRAKHPARARRDSVAVSLVSMPFKDLRHPPIQLGILQRALEQAGIRARSHSFELTFMEHLNDAALPDGTERLTIADYQDVAHKQFVVQLGDWIFKVPPYADSSAEDDEYLAYIRTEGISERAIANAIRMKKLVPEFLEAAARELLAGQPRIVGFSSVFQQNLASLVLAKMLKQRDPSLVIVFGGDNCDGVMGAALHESFPWIDAVVRGEGEKVLVEIAQDALASSPIQPRPGLCYRDGERSVAVPQESRPELPMAEVPSPVYDEYFDRLAHSPLRVELWPDVAILFESSRGCWWGAKAHCTFCGLNDSTMFFRSKPARRVADEILDMARRYRVLKFVAVDDIIDLAHVRELLPMLREAGCDLEIYYETKANLTKDQLRTFFTAGVDQIQPGIESLSTTILRLMRKGVTALQNIRLLKWCAEIGISPDWNLLYGFPGEPPEEYERMADIIPSLVHFEPPNFTPIQIQRFRSDWDLARLEPSVRLPRGATGGIRTHGRHHPVARAFRTAEFHAHPDPALQPLLRATGAVRPGTDRTDALLSLPVRGPGRGVEEHRVRLRAPLSRRPRSRLLHHPHRRGRAALADVEHTGLADVPARSRLSHRAGSQARLRERRLPVR